MSVIIDSGLTRADLNEADLNQLGLHQPGARHAHPDFNVVVTMRLLVTGIAMTALAAAGLFAYGQVSPGI